VNAGEAARRRDFTINAIGWDPLTGEYLDPFNGRADLRDRILRVVDPNTFADDLLRVLLGRHLIAMGVTPGPRMGKILKAVYELQLDSAVQTLDEARERAKELIDRQT
jgi:hypothetical protein